MKIPYFGGYAEDLMTILGKDEDFQKNYKYNINENFWFRTHSIDSMKITTRFSKYDIYRTYVILHYS